MMTRDKNNILYNNRKINNNSIMFTIIIIIALCFSILGGMRLVQADESVEYEKNFYAIEVQTGDTLTSIAQEYAQSKADYQDYMEEVIEINQLKDDKIHAGCYLMIPVYTEVSSK